MDSIMSLMLPLALIISPSSPPPIKSTLSDITTMVNSEMDPPTMNKLLLKLISKVRLNNWHVDKDTPLL